LPQATWLLCHRCRDCAPGSANPARHLGGELADVVCHRKATVAATAAHARRVAGSLMSGATHVTGTNPRAADPVCSVSASAPSVAVPTWRALRWCARARPTRVHFHRTHPARAVCTLHAEHWPGGAAPSGRRGVRRSGCGGVGRGQENQR
jgi:hypothetical protein